MVHTYSIQLDEIKNSINWIDGVLSSLSVWYQTGGIWFPWYCVGALGKLTKSHNVSHLQWIIIIIFHHNDMEHVWCGEWIILDISIYAQKHNGFNHNFSSVRMFAIIILYHSVWNTKMDCKQLSPRKKKMRMNRMRIDLDFAFGATK